MISSGPDGVELRFMACDASVHADDSQTH